MRITEEERLKRARISQQKYYAKNKEKISEYRKSWYKNNKDKFLEYRKSWYEQNPHKAVEYSENRLGYIRKAKPLWANDEEIKSKYNLCVYMNKFFNEVFHVDHIIPLQGKNVCGLHLETNLRVIPAKDNLSKSNKFEVEI